MDKPALDTFKESNSQIFIVEASAGSGKTYALARRYLKLLLNALARQEEDALRSILAITFMNKAAVEMKERILELLKRLALDTFQDKIAEKELIEYIGLDELSCRKASFRAMQEIIRRYDYFQVQTIDSFINSLLLGCAFRLGLSANFSIRQDYNKYIALGLDELLDLAAQDEEVKKLFLDFVWHYLSIENRLGWLAKNDIFSVTKSLFSEFNRYGVPFYIHPIVDKEIAVKKNEIYKRIVKISKDIDRDGIDKRFVKGVKDFIGENDAGFQLDSLSSMSWQKEEIPCNKQACVPAALNVEWGRLRLEIKELCEMEAYSLFNPYIQIFKKAFRFFLRQTQKEDILFLEELNSRASWLFGKGAISVPEIYFRIGSRFRHFLIDEFQDTSVLQWKNIFILAEEALSTGGTLFYVGDKKQAIYRFRGGEAGLFEGVKKELAQFGQKEDVLGRNYRSAKEIVEFNNRVFSPENLKRFIAAYNAKKQAKAGNDLYFKFFPAFEKELLQVFLHSKQEVQLNTGSLSSAGYVALERFDIQSAEEMSDTVRSKLLGLIEDLRRRSFDFKDIAVLSRSGDKVEEISGWLIKEGIPVESEKTLNIRENILVKEVVSFLRFLDSPIDNLAFASFILGEIFCAASGLAAEDIADFIFTNRKQEKKGEVFTAYLYRAFQKEFPLVWQRHIEKFFKNAGFLPLYEMLATIYADFSVLERFPGNQSFFMSFLELVIEKENEYNGIKAFLGYFEDAASNELYVKFPASNAVKVMTVHKAKGLEFPVVIIPFLKINPKAESISDNRAASYIPDFNHKENSLRLLRLKEDYRRFSEEIRIRYNEEYFRSFLDELNNIYVSFTRAKQELYIFIPKKQGLLEPAELLIPDDFTPPQKAHPDELPRSKLRGINFFTNRNAASCGELTPRPASGGIKNDVTQCVISSGVREYNSLAGFTELGRKGMPQEKREGQDMPQILGPARYSDWIGGIKEEFKDCSQLRFYKQIKEGEVMHYVFSLLGNLYGKDPDSELNKCLVFTQLRFPEFEDFAELKIRIRMLLNDARFKELFFCEASLVFTEKEVVNRLGDARRIDRLILKDNEAIIVDFKSAGEKKENEISSSVQQIKEYIGLIKAVYPDKLVKGYLLYADEFLLKEVF